MCQRTPKLYVTNLEGRQLQAAASCSPTRPASVDQVHTKNNKHTPVMVYVDLMNKHYTVVTLSTNRSRPVTIEQFHTKVGAPVDRSP